MMEQQNISVQLKGINLSAPVDSGQDGICGHIVNLRFKDGAWRLAGEKISEITLAPENEAILLESSNLLYVKEASAAIICVYNGVSIPTISVSTGDVILIDIESQTKMKLVEINHAAGEVVNDIKSFGKFLIVVTNFMRYILKYDNDADNYFSIPDVPEGQVAFWDDTRIPATNEGNIWYIPLGDVVEYPQAINALKKKLFDDGVFGYFEGHVFFRLAWRLYDGSYINHSAVHYTHVGLFQEKLSIGFYGQTIKVRCYLTNNPIFEIKFSPEELIALESLKGIVSGIVIFMTNPISSYDFGSDITSWNPVEKWGLSWHEAPMKESSVFSDLFENSMTFYKVSSYDIEDILLWEEIGSAGYRKVSDSIIVENVHSIETREAMSMDNFTHHKLSGKSLYDYNSRLHFSDTITAFANPINNGRYQLINDDSNDYLIQKKALVFGAAASMVETPNYSALFYVEVDLMTEDGLRMTRLSAPQNVLAKFGITPYYNSTEEKHYIYLKEIISYPDLRARNFRLCIKSDTTNDNMVLLGIELKEHPHLNCAYYQSTFFSDVSNGYISINKILIPEVVINNHVVKPINNILRDTNRVQASALGNIFVYPALNSYRIGQKGNTVIALASMSSPMSEGQFGAFPIHVFSESGIFTLNQGQGDILYSSVVRFNIDKLTSKNQLLELGGAIVYASRSGLYLLAGSQRKRISQALESKYGIESSSDYWGFPEGECRSALTMIDFETFMQGAVMAYSHVENEIIISNPTGMSYVFQIDTGSWYKSSQSFNDFVMKVDGSYLAIDSTGALSEVDSENTANDYSENICFVTRPMRLGNRGFKKIARLLGRMVFNVVSGSSVKMSVYGSLNGRDWELMRSVAFDDGVNDLSLNDIMIKDTHASAKYFIVSFKAVVGSDFEFTGMDMTVEPRFTRKLR